MTDEEFSLCFLNLSKFKNMKLYIYIFFSFQTAMDQLHMHFTQAIHNTVFQVVLGYVELCAENTDTKFQKLQYKDLCTVCNSLVIGHMSFPFSGLKFIFPFSLYSPLEDYTERKNVCQKFLLSFRSFLIEKLEAQSTGD